LDADLGEAFWVAVRPNLQKFGDVVEMAKIVKGPVTPVIEDAAFAEAALRLLPETIGADAWSVWTNAVKTETGAKGKGLFMPLRLALTGQLHGPDMAAMVPLIGRETLERRLRGEAA
jgi:glutamyl-tRNA synthetase